jgi:hypothetical protein
MIEQITAEGPGTAEKNAKKKIVAIIKASF